jgi:hypothetical protein
LKFSFIIPLVVSCAYGISDTIEWKFQKGFDLNRGECGIILHLAKKVGLKNIYQVKVGNVYHYENSYVVVVKGVVSTNDTLQKERWLYLWKKEWLKESKLFKHFGDSSVVDSPFVTGHYSIQKANRFVYTYGNLRKLFCLELGSYQEVKAILDCILGGNSLEDSIRFDETVVREMWNDAKKNILKFVVVDERGDHHYDFLFKIKDLGSLYQYRLKKGLSPAGYIGIGVKRIVINNKCRMVFEQISGSSGVDPEMEEWHSAMK